MNVKLSGNSRYSKQNFKSSKKDNENVYENNPQTHESFNSISLPQIPNIKNDFQYPDDDQMELERLSSIENERDSRQRNADRQ